MDIIIAILLGGFVAIGLMKLADATPKWVGDVMQIGLGVVVAVILIV